MLVSSVVNAILKEKIIHPKKALRSVLHQAIQLKNNTDNSSSQLPADFGLSITCCQHFWCMLLTPKNLHNVLIKLKPRVSHNTNI